MSGGAQQSQQGGWGGQPFGYQGQRSNVNPWSGYTPAQAYPGNNYQNFLGLYQYPPFNRAEYTNNPLSAPLPAPGGGPAPSTPPAPPPGWTGGSPTGQYTGIPTQTGVGGGNSLPPPGNSVVTTPPIANPASAPQSVYNDMLSKYGQNAAMSFALSNRGLMGNVGIDQLSGLDPTTRNQAINTYSGASKSNDLGGGARHDLTAMGNPFDPNSAIARYRAMLGG